MLVKNESILCMGLVPICFPGEESKHSDASQAEPRSLQGAHGIMWYVGMAADDDIA